ncbi:MAG: hypothetical protein H7645_06240 [Candidatus Heimdallarchaeota archaeon]|nr:hypothetical protein [Candidatus Heimdallarchaeota archaeon]MCK4769922.1 hypothetical protein [Candidatus Heimdallarchaeota archaeon]
MTVAIFSFVLPFCVNYYSIMRGIFKFSAIPEAPSTIINQEFDFTSAAIKSFIVLGVYLILGIVSLILLKQRKTVLNSLILTQIFVFTFQSVLLITARSYFTSAHYLGIQPYMILIYGILGSFLIFTSVNREQIPQLFILYLIMTFGLLIIPWLIYSMIQHFRSYAFCLFHNGSYCEEYSVNIQVVKIILYMSLFFLFLVSFFIIYRNERLKKLFAIIPIAEAIFPLLYIINLFVIHRFTGNSMLTASEIIQIGSTVIYTALSIMMILQISKKSIREQLSFKSFFAYKNETKIL